MTAVRSRGGAADRTGADAHAAENSVPAMRLARHHEPRYTLAAWIRPIRIPASLCLFASLTQPPLEALHDARDPMRTSVTDIELQSAECAAESSLRPRQPPMAS